MKALRTRLGAKEFNLLTIQEAQQQLTEKQKRRGERLEQLKKHLNE